MFYSNYVATYIERDVTDLVNVSSLKTFRQFIKKCASLSGSVLNYNKISNELDVSVNTIKNWISILEMSFIVFTINKHYSNLGKRITKSPKLYFLDTGLLCYLLEIENTEELILSQDFGKIFETFIISQFYKKYLHLGKTPNFTFFRDSNGNEIDFINTYKKNVDYYEIKSGITFKTEFTNVMMKLLKEEDKKNLIYRGDKKFNFKSVTVIPWNEVDYGMI
ncbi:MAG: DUF4143 domain-containing protein [Saprospiraceae bacterium]